MKLRKMKKEILNNLPKLELKDELKDYANKYEYHQHRQVAFWPIRLSILTTIVLFLALFIGLGSLIDNKANSTISKTDGTIVSNKPAATSNRVITTPNSTLSSSSKNVIETQITPGDPSASASEEGASYILYSNLINDTKADEGNYLTYEMFKRQVVGSPTLLTVFLGHKEIVEGTLKIDGFAYEVSKASEYSFQLLLIIGDKEVVLEENIAYLSDDYTAKVESSLVKMEKSHAFEVDSGWFQNNQERVELDLIMINNKDSKRTLVASNYFFYTKFDYLIFYGTRSNSSESYDLEKTPQGWK